MDANSIEFYDLSRTFANSSSLVSCCHQNETREIVSCGLGTSCAGQCFALGASLCPSGVCSGNPADCQIGFDIDARSTATLPSTTTLQWCRARCDVRRHKNCCYHPTCRQRKPCDCLWLNYQRTSSGLNCSGSGSSGSEGKTLCLTCLTLFLPAVDSSWASWGAWGGCSETCGGGVRRFLCLLFILHCPQTQTRSRSCNVAQHGGSTSTCSSSASEHRPCNSQNCRKFDHGYHGKMNLKLDCNHLRLD